MSRRKRENKKNKPPKRENDFAEDNPLEQYDEAIEERGFHEEEAIEQSEEEGEDLEENISGDYEPIPGLDKYEAIGIDEEQYKKMSPEERRAAEREIALREQRKKVKSKIPAAIIEQMEGSDEEEALRLKRRKMMKFGEKIIEEEIEKEENYINQGNVKGNEIAWIEQPQEARYIRAAFSKFLKTYKEKGDNIVYENRITDMSKNNKQSLEINFPHIHTANQNLSRWVLLYPDIVLPYLNDVAFELTCEIFPRYSDIYKEIFVRIKDLPILITLRNLRCEDIGHLIKIKGVITKRTNVYPKLRVAYFACVKCGEENGPYTQISEKCLFRNYQRITIQESPGTVPVGRVPRQKEVILTNDLVDMARPGDEVEISGIYNSRFDASTNLKHSFPIFNTYIEANCVKRLNDIEFEELTEDDKIEIRKLSKNPNITKIIFNSIAPSIYGNDFLNF